MSSSTPTARRRELTRYFRELRLQRGYQLGQVAGALGTSVSTASRIDSGLRTIPLDEAEKLADLYALPMRERHRILKVAREAQGTSWWEDPRYPKSARDFIGLEQAAVAISTFSCSMIPGLLQTPEYARAVVRATDPSGDEEYREAAVLDRMRRQEILDREDPPWIHVVLDEAVVQRRVGSPEARRDQLQALVDASTRPRVTLQILPFTAGAHVGMDSRFTMIHIEDPARPDLVHVEGLAGYLSREGKAEIARYQRAWHALLAAALPADQTRSFLREMPEASLP